MYFVGGNERTTGKESMASRDVHQRSQLFAQAKIGLYLLPSISFTSFSSRHKKVKHTVLQRPMTVSAELQRVTSKIVTVASRSALVTHNAQPSVS